MDKIKEENKQLNHYIDTKVRKKQHIYTIYFKEESDKIYIGKTRQSIRRPTEHKNELRNNRHPNEDLQHLFNQYGEDSFVITIIDAVRMTNEEALIHEGKIIDKYKEDYTMLNRIHNETFQGGRPKDFVDAEKFAEVYPLWKSRVSALACFIVEYVKLKT